MMLTLRVAAKCPYCGRIEKQSVNFTDTGVSQIWHCPHDEGGCDRRFVVDVWLEQEVKTNKIEGEPEDKLAF